MPAATGTVRVRGLRELNAAFKKMGRDVQKDVRDKLKAVGEPVRAAAEANAVTNIANIGSEWSRMRLGVTSKMVYVAPRARTKRGTPRPNLAVLLLNDAMIPAVNAHEGEIVSGLEDMLDRLADKGRF